MATEVSRSDIPQWRFAPGTSCIAEDEYADLDVVDISCFVGNESKAPQCRRETIRRATDSFKEVGFIVLTGHGLDPKMISRQFDLGKLFLDEVSEEEKQRLHAKIEDGSWAGYKPKGYYKRSNGSYDSTEFHDFYPYTVTETQQPLVSWPYLSEINDFYVYNHFVLVQTVLNIISEGLGLPSDSLWNLHHRQGYTHKDTSDIHTKDLFRAAMYHPPLEEDREKTNRLWLPSHTDRGSVTLLYSQPIAGLQVLVHDRWKYVRHYPNGIIVNIGDALEFISGGILKAALHRVSEPPADQRHLRRLGLFYFATMLPDVPLEPIKPLTSPSQHTPDIFYEFQDLEGRVPTAEEWQIKRTKCTGKAADIALLKKRFQNGAVLPKT